MLHAYREHSANAIGMSGLLVKSTLIMKENLEVLNEQEVTVPIILGGAALTRRYVEEDLRNIYKGKVFYANDAFDGLHLMEKIISKNLEYEEQQEDEEETLVGLEAKIALSKTEPHEASARSNVSMNVPIPNPPFLGSKTVENIDLDEIFKYVNEVALFRGQWQFRKKKLSEQEYKKLMDEKVYPIYNSLKEKCKKEKLLMPKVVYGYFPCQSQGDDLIIYKLPETDLNGMTTENIGKEHLDEWLRFTFPRQKDGKHLCISDFFASKESGKTDVVGFHIVTMGSVASEYSQKLFKEDKYQDYLFFHGLSVESAEALAELWHKKIREELGIADKDSPNIRRLFAQIYQGSRYSFGYPACPNLEDQTKIFELLKPERIDITLTEEFQLVPEQSTSAIIVHHPEAKYFNV
jgi:5-methyltetrahydrofolate--homocysteine methyltransferase